MLCPKQLWFWAEFSPLFCASREFILATWLINTPMFRFQEGYIGLFKTFRIFWQVFVIEWKRSLELSRNSTPILERGLWVDLDRWRDRSRRIKQILKRKPSSHTNYQDWREFSMFSLIFHCLIGSCRHFIIMSG